MAEFNGVWQKLQFEKDCYR